MTADVKKNPKKTAELQTAVEKLIFYGLPSKAARRDRSHYVVDYISMKVVCQNVKVLVTITHVCIMSEIWEVNVLQENRDYEIIHEGYTSDM